MYFHAFFHSNAKKKAPLSPYPASFISFLLLCDKEALNSMVLGMGHHNPR